ncbi:hypothetical protein L2E82_14744 [Cichorium intybus]|uniref:Uncharacterized protein n=1 Tax=Cichorium intybus TaxID=13427 RepID=A0ACB9F192_CICIN|nr:hypothetical protein L2E82_14744 [Cichorium intybus]
MNFSKLHLKNPSTIFRVLIPTHTELEKIAMSIEEKFFIAATSQSDYMRNICFKILNIETRSQNPMPDAKRINPSDLVKSGIMEPKLTEEDCDFKGLPPKDKDVEKRLMGKFTTPVHGNTSSTTKNPLWAQIPGDKTIVSAGAGLSDADIEQRSPGVVVDALSKSSEEFVVVSGQNPVKSLGLLCFKEEDSQTLLGQMKAMDPIMRPGSKVVPVVLSMLLDYEEQYADIFLPREFDVQFLLVKFILYTTLFNGV